MTNSNGNGVSHGEVKVEVKDGPSADEVDFAKISVDEALKILGASPHGLTTAEAQKRLLEYGPNKLPESSRNPILVFLSYMWNPLAWAMEVAAIISIILLDYADFALIMGLLIVNSVISYYEESNADKAIKALTAALAPKALALRDGTVSNIDAVNLVPGDVIIVRLGNIVAADVKILSEDTGGSEETPLQVDQAALTGESLPVKKFSGDVAFSGSAIKQGERHAVVYATGVNTFFGRAAALISGTNNVANLQIVMNRIGALCLVTIIVWVIITVTVQFVYYEHSCGMGEEACPTLVNMLVIIVGGIPIAMPTVLSVTLALGAYKLAKEGAIVARMSAVEEMASMDVLCSDKTGTLTLNKLTVETQSMHIMVPGMTAEELLKMGALSANTITEEPIDVVLENSYPHVAQLKKDYKMGRFIPFNPVDKFTCATMEELATGKKTRYLKGSPQIVLGKAWNKDQISDTVNQKIVEFANRGFRSLGIARAEGDGVGETTTRWEMVGLLPLFDPPRHDTKATIERCHELGVEVKMITGDHLLIGIETAKMLGMGHEMYASEVLIKGKNGDKAALKGMDIHKFVESVNGFAEVFPEHKFEIVEILQDADHVCGMTGDGVNDAPALKKADVGIAVDGATDAARGAADIVLTQPGLATIATAIVGARKIFQRMTTYAKYTVSVTFRICFTFGLLTVIYNWYFPTILIVILAVFNDGSMIALSKDKVVPSKTPNSWDLTNVFISGIVYGLYLTLSSWVLYHVAQKSTFFEDNCGLFSLDDRHSSLRDWCTVKLNEERDRLLNMIPGVTPSPNVDVLTTSVCAIPHYAKELAPWQCENFDLAANIVTPPPGTPNLLQQCEAEQKYMRGGMMRSLLYCHVSVSGAALVFVVRNPGYSLFQRAGTATYIAFVVSQICATLIAIFGFDGYVHPRFKFHDCEFCGLSTGGPVPFYNSKHVPIALTESVFTASVMGCTGYVIVAWIWSAIWYVALDPIKWGIMWVLNEDGFRNMKAHQDEVKRTAEMHHRVGQVDKEAAMGPAGMVAPTVNNPLGRASISKPVAHMLDRKSASVVAVKRDSAGISRVSADPRGAMGIARKSLIKTAETTPAQTSNPVTIARRSLGLGRGSAGNGKPKEIQVAGK